MTWLKDFFLIAARWIFKNPLLVALVIVISAFNAFSSKLGLDTSTLNVLRADSIWNFALVAIQFFLHPINFLILVATFAAAAALTMFNTGAMLAVFAGEKRSLPTALTTMCSWRTVEYFALQTITNAVLVGLFLFLAWFLVLVCGLSGLAGSIIIGVVAAVVYPLWYVLLSTSSLILAPLTPLRERLSFFSVLFGRKNLPRLCTFYLIRIGAEAVAAYLVLALAHAFHFPALLSVLFVVLFASVPFAFVRTTGLVMKLDMLRNTAWFASYFRQYYEMEGRARV